MPHHRLVPLDRVTCLRLLAGAQVGRVVHTDRALPACTPVTFRLVGESVVFRTSAHSRLAAATADAVVAFEVDDIDPDSSTGWTVTVTGVATAVTDVSTLVRLDALGLVAWAGPDRRHWVRIAIADIGGRRIAAADEALPAAPRVSAAAVPAAGVSAAGVSAAGVSAAGVSAAAVPATT